jgi:hypothetical protein
MNIYDLIEKHKKENIGSILTKCFGRQMPITPPYQSTILQVGTKYGFDHPLVISRDLEPTLNKE